MHTRRRQVRHAVPLVLAGAAFVAAGGFVHLREWLDTYRQVPADLPGAAVVRIGFPVQAATSLVAAVALVVAAWRRPRWAPVAIGAAVVLEAVSLGVLIGTRTGTVLGWAEPVWTAGAAQSRALEVGALLALAAAALVEGVGPRDHGSTRPQYLQRWRASARA